jgi:Uma2 family endonuclease
MTTLAAPPPVMTPAEKIEATAPTATPHLTIAAPLVLYARPAIPVSDEEFFQFCRDNRHLRVERTKEGEWIIMAPTGWEGGTRSGENFRQLANWARQDGTGIAADSSTGVRLPNGADRSPDACWVLKSRLAALTPEQRTRFLPLCPDFVAEVRSSSDSLSVLQAKMDEYLACGARLGLLLDPTERIVYVYRPGQAAPTVLDDPETVPCDPELPGFVLDARTIFDTGF